MVRSSTTAPDPNTQPLTGKKRLSVNELPQSSPLQPTPVLVLTSFLVRGMMQINVNDLTESSQTGWISTLLGWLQSPHCGHLQPKAFRGRVKAGGGK
jgi:hypothetical protein